MTTTTSTSTTTDNAASEPLLREAFDRHLPAMMALPADRLQIINLDIPSVVTTALGAWGEIKTMRPLLARELPSFDLASFDLLEEYAMAMGHAHLAFQSSSVSNDALVGLHNRAQELRDLFLSDVQALVRRGAIPAPQVAEFKGAVGYKNVGFELLGLAGVLRQSWAQIQGRTGVAAAELDEAERLGQQLLKAAGEREQAPSVATEVAQIRQRAFTLFMRTYDAARRAINFLRWEQDDADSIIPPLYPGRPRKSHKAAPAEAGKPPVVTPVAPVAPGLPGGSPFLS